MSVFACTGSSRCWLTAAVVAMLAAMLAGCSPQVDPPETDAALETVSPEVQKAAAERGKAIANETFGLLRTNLQTAMESGGVSNALPFCSVAALPLTQSMAEKHGVTVRRISHKARNPANRAGGAELEVLQQFETGLATGSETNLPGPVITNLVPGKVTFFAPIVLSHDLCLKCHGEPGRDLAPEHLGIIRKHYPQDQAIGFQRGQLRGAWRIDFPMASLNNPGASTP